MPKANTVRAVVRSALQSHNQLPKVLALVEEARVELEDRTDHLPTRVRNALVLLKRAAELPSQGESKP